jgi:hypothetical protein
MKSISQICRESSSFLGGRENAYIIAEAIANNDTHSLLEAVKGLPEGSSSVVRLLLNSSVPARNQR